MQIACAWCTSCRKKFYCTCRSCLQHCCQALDNERQPLVPLRLHWIRVVLNSAANKELQNTHPVHALISMRSYCKLVGILLADSRTNDLPTLAFEHISELVFAVCNQRSTLETRTIGTPGAMVDFLWFFPKRNQNDTGEGLTRNLDIEPMMA